MAAKIKQFTSANLRDFQTKMAEVLSAEAPGMTVRQAGGKYDDFSATLKFEFKIASEAAEVAVADKDKRQFEMYAEVFGLKPTDYGRTFGFKGKPFTICGVSPNSTKYPILAKNIDGKVYKFRGDQTARALEARA